MNQKGASSVMKKTGTPGNINSAKEIRSLWKCEDWVFCDQLPLIISCKEKKCCALFETYWILLFSMLLTPLLKTPGRREYECIRWKKLVKNVFKLWLKGEFQQFYSACDIGRMFLGRGFLKLFVHQTSTSDQVYRPLYWICMCEGCMS